MKLTIFLLTAAILNVSAKGISQSITFSTKGMALEKVFSVIKEQTKYVVVCNARTLEGIKPVAIAAEKMDIDTFLKNILKGLPLKYSIKNKTIIISRAPAVVVSSDQLSLALPLVSGIVSGPDRKFISGVSVRVRGTSNGTFTDESGRFTLTNLADNAVLQVSSVGFERMEIPLSGFASGSLPTLKGVKSSKGENGALNLEISLSLSVDSLQNYEVNVITTGYQRLPRERATGAFGTVDKEQLEKPSINIASRLIGTMAGVQTRLNADGVPTFEIRGLSTFTTSNAAPLVVVDGFPIQGTFNSINPNDVESVTVLKDAAAASIWGAKSANGVIVVTTKNPKKGNPMRIEFNAFTRIGGKIDLDYTRALASPAETVEMERLLSQKPGWNSFNVTGALTQVTAQLPLASMLLAENKLGFLSTADLNARLEQLKTQDNRKQIEDDLLSNPVNQQYNLSIFGATDRMSNAISILFEDNNSNFKGTGNKRYMLNFRHAFSVLKWLDFNLNGMLQHNRNTNNGVSLSELSTIAPYEMLKNKDGSLTDIAQYYTPLLNRQVPTALFPYPDWTYNPIREVENRDLTEQQLNARIQAGLTFKLVKGLTVDSRIQYEHFNTFNRSYYNPNTFFVRNTVNTTSAWTRATATTPNIVTPNLPKGGILNQNRVNQESYIWRSQLNYNEDIASDHHIDFVAGSEISSQVTRTFINPTSYGYSDESLTVGTFPNGPGGPSRAIQNFLGTSISFPYTNSFGYNTERYFSVFSNLAYTYKRKYTLSGSYRTDASNMIADDPKYRYSPFWSVGGLWHAHLERFMQNVDFVDRLTFRATYGYNGNVDRSTSFQPLITTSGTPNLVTNQFTATVASFGNPTLRWEKTRSINLGTEFSLMRGKLFGKVDLYKKNGFDLIAALAIPSANGTNSQRLNNAEMSNKGVEVEIGSLLHVTSKINWRGSLNFSYNANKVERLYVVSTLPLALALGSVPYVEGSNANAQWRFVYAGMQDKQITINGPGGQLLNLLGDLPGTQFRDYMQNTGTSVAPYTMGMTNSIDLYNFNFSFIITGQFGHVFKRKSYNYAYLSSSRSIILPNSRLSETLNADPSKIVPLPQNDVEPRYTNWGSPYVQLLNYLMTNASHLRLQEVNLTYSFKPPLLSRTGLKRAQVYIQGNDLYTVLFNDFGEDPQYPLGTINPRPKFTFGLRVEL